MPFYDYKCAKCDDVFEEFLPLKDRKKPERAACPKCGEKGSVKQHISGVAGVAMDANHRIDGNAKGGFRDVMRKVVEAPGIKNSRRANYYKTRWGLN